MAAKAADLTHPALRNELLKMAAVDQQVRSQQGEVDYSKWHAVDAANQTRLKQVVAKHGWPTFDMVGKDGASAAWLLAQHADTDPAFQQKVLEMMEPLVKRDQASGKNFAYLYDRTHYPQRFGTQGACVSRTQWQPFEITDMANVDVRRKSLDMTSLADYAKVFKDICSNPNMPLYRGTDSKRTVAIPTDPE